MARWMEAGWNNGGMDIEKHGIKRIFWFICSRVNFLVHWTIIVENTWDTYLNILCNKSGFFCLHQRNPKGLLNLRKIQLTAATYPRYPKVHLWKDSNRWEQASTCMFQRYVGIFFEGGSLYYHCKGNPTKITTDLHCLIPPQNGWGCSDPVKFKGATAWSMSSQDL